MFVDGAYLQACTVVSLSDVRKRFSIQGPDNINWNSCPSGRYLAVNKHMWFVCIFGFEKIITFKNGITGLDHKRNFGGKEGRELKK